MFWYKKCVSLVISSPVMRYFWFGSKMEDTKGRFDTNCVKMYKRLKNWKSITTLYSSQNMRYCLLHYIFFVMQVLSILRCNPRLIVTSTVRLWLGHLLSNKILFLHLLHFFTLRGLLSILMYSIKVKSTLNRKGWNIKKWLTKRSDKIIVNNVETLTKSRFVWW